MRTAFHSVAFDTLPLDEVMRLVARHGYDAIELNAETLPWAGPHVTPQTDPAERERIAALARELGLDISAISAHISLIDPDATEREKARSFTRGCIDLAVDVGVPVVHGLSGDVAPGVDPEVAWVWLVDAVQESAAYADARGIRFAFEAIVNHLVARTAELEQLIDQVGNGLLWVNFDPSHYQVMGDDPVEAAERLAGRTVHAHLKDAQGVPHNFTFPPLGEGRVDFDGVVAALRAGGYDGYLSVEYEAQVYGFERTPEQILADSHAFATRLIDQAGERERQAS